MVVLLFSYKIMSHGTGTLTMVLYISSDHKRFILSMMDNIEWCDNDNNIHSFSILKEACYKWDEIATHLVINKAAVKEKFNANKDRFKNVLETWIKNGGNDNYPATWMGLKKMLNVCELNTCVQKIKDAMKYLDI